MELSTVLIFSPLAIGLLTLAKFRRDAASALSGPEGVSPGIITESPSIEARLEIFKQNFPSCFSSLRL